jgi:hypothetical protein
VKGYASVKLTATVGANATITVGDTEKKFKEAGTYTVQGYAKHGDSMNQIKLKVSSGSNIYFRGGQL